MTFKNQTNLGKQINVVQQNLLIDVEVVFSIYKHFFKRTLLESSRYMNGPSKLHASFLGLNYVFSVQAWYICLNLIDLSRKKYILFIQS